MLEICITIILVEEWILFIADPDSKIFKNILNMLWNNYILNWKVLFGAKYNNNNLLERLEGGFVGRFKSVKSILKIS